MQYPLWLIRPFGPARQTVAALFILLIGLGSSSLVGFAQDYRNMPLRSTFNGNLVLPPDSGWACNFMLGGHLYGSHKNSESIFPAASFLGNLYLLNQRPMEFFMGLGDVVRNGEDPAQLDAIARSMRGLKTPVYNAPGNHDIAGGKMFLERFGFPRGNIFKREGHVIQQGFRIRSDLFLILNTEHLVNGNAAKLLKFIQQERKRQAVIPQKTRNIFVFSHRLLWPLCAEGYGEMENYINEPLGPLVDKDSTCMSFQMLGEIERTGELYFFAGDVGAEWSLPLFYEKDPKTGWHYAACGLGDMARDVLLQVAISPEGKVNMKPYPLGSIKYGPLADYGLSFWQKNFTAHPQEKPNFISKIKGVFGKKIFWAGLLAGLLIAGIAGWLLRKRRRTNV